MASMKGQVGGGDFLSVIRFSIKWQYVSGIAWKLVFTLDQRVSKGGRGVLHERCFEVVCGI